MRRTKRDINTVTGTFMNVSGKILIYVLILFLLFTGITRGYRYGYEVFAPTALEQQPGTDYEIVIEENSSVSDVAKLLEEKGLIKDRNIFILQAKLYEYTMHPGTYTLNTSETSKEMLRRIDEGGEKDGDKNS